MPNLSSLTSTKTKPNKSFTGIAPASKQRHNNMAFMAPQAQMQHKALVKLQELWGAVHLLVVGGKALGQALISLNSLVQTSTPSVIVVCLAMHLIKSIVSLSTVNLTVACLALWALSR